MGKKLHGSIILTYDVDGHDCPEFYMAADAVEREYEDAIGIGLVYDGQVDTFREEKDEYDVNFEKWVTFHSTVDSVLIKDSERPLKQAVYCRSITKLGKCCKNKTRDPSLRCWRHRDCCRSL